MPQLREHPGCEGISLNTLAYFHPIEPWWQTIKTAITKELPKYNFRVPRRRRFSNVVNTLLLAAIGCKSFKQPAVNFAIFFGLTALPKLVRL